MAEGVSLLPYGPRAVLVELPDAATRRALTAWLNEHPVEAVDCIPAETTILLDVSDPGVDAATAHHDLRRMVRRLRALDLGSLPHPSESASEPLTIEVRYDGPDLHPTADALGRSVEAFVTWHTASPWIVEFLGFMPGFGYLTRSDHDRPVERQASPRRAIAVGSVGLAGPYCGIYPGSSPGGWQLIGHTEHVMFDASGAGAALAANDRVQFRAAR